MQKTNFILFFLLCWSMVVWAQPKVVTFAELDSLQQIEARKVVVFIYTDWCRYCHRMEQNSLAAKENERLLNEHFYFIRLNAEKKEAIDFMGHRFEFRPSGMNTGIHELAQALASMEGQVSYPSICVLNEATEIVFQYQQFITPKELTAVLEALEKS